MGWHQWVFQQLDLPPQARVLEIGSGPAYLWQANLPNLGPENRFILSDLSPGMLEEARAALGGFSQFSYTILDGTHLPFPEGFFDAVIANHMLYHLAVIPSALYEIKRVLKPACCLYAATNGRAHLQEILRWKEQFLPGELDREWGTASTRFSLENGQDQLEVYFHSVQMRRYPDRLDIDQVEPLLAYIHSYSDRAPTPEIRKRLRTFLESILADKGMITVTKDTGLFLAVKH